MHMPHMHIPHMQRGAYAYPAYADECISICGICRGVHMHMQYMQRGAYAYAGFALLLQLDKRPGPNGEEGNVFVIDPRADVVRNDFGRAV